MKQFEGIERLGPTKAQALVDAGITSLEDLAALDFRKSPEVAGVSTDALKGFKAQARRILAARGAPIPKAPYRKGHAEEPVAEPVAEPMVRLRPKRGLLAKVFGR